ncbi:hypothetical protein G6F65_012155 [Rhizopus arrhizus]|nr:hypothetical protein G6F65_012155 [Rhizopus arrhizus]
MARFGAIDITRVYAGALNNAFPLTQALCLPYVFRSVAHQRAALDSGVADTVLRGFESRDLVGLAIYDSGARCFYNTKHPIISPKDLHGLKLRVASSDIFIQLMRLLGANPTPMSLGDTFSGMETHMIDGAENNMRSYHSSRHFEAAHYWSQSDHSYAPDVLLMSRARFERLGADDRQLLLHTARASVTVMREHWDASEDAARRAVLAYGVKANEVDMPAFRAAAQPLLKQYLQQPDIAALTLPATAGPAQRLLDRIADIAINCAVAALLGLVVLDRAGHPAAAGHGDEPGRRLRRAYQPPLRLLPAARSHGPWRAPRGGCAGAGGGGRAGWVHRLLVGRPAAGRAGHQDRRRQPAAEHQLPAAGRGWCADGAVRAEPCVESAAGPRRRQRRR